MHKTFQVTKNVHYLISTLPITRIIQNHNFHLNVLLWHSLNLLECRWDGFWEDIVIGQHRKQRNMQKRRPLDQKYIKLNRNVLCIHILTPPQKYLPLLMLREYCSGTVQNCQNKEIWRLKKKTTNTNLYFYMRTRIQDLSDLRSFKIHTTFVVLFFLGCFLLFLSLGVF